MHRAICISIVLFCTLPNYGWSQGISGKVAKEGLKVVKTVLFGTAAAASLGKAGNASKDYFNATENTRQSRAEFDKFRRQRIADLDKQFRSQGLHENEYAIYSLFLNLDYNKDALYWADYLSNPDVFFVLEIEGIGNFTIPLIMAEYKGGPMLCTLVLPIMKPSTRVLVRVMDDDTSSNDAWNSLLRQKISFGFTIDHVTTTSIGILKIGTETNGTFQFLKDNQKILIDAPDQLATFLFQIPDKDEPKWLADGELFDSSNQSVGRIQFSQIWNRKAELDSIESKLKQNISNAEIKESSSLGWLIFWLVAGGLCLYTFFNPKVLG